MWEYILSFAFASVILALVVLVIVFRKKIWPDSTAASEPVLNSNETKPSDTEQPSPSNDIKSSSVDPSDPSDPSDDVIATPEQPVEQDVDVLVPIETEPNQNTNFPPSNSDSNSVPVIDQNSASDTSNTSNTSPSTDVADIPANSTSENTAPAAQNSTPVVVIAEQPPTVILPPCLDQKKQFIEAEGGVPLDLESFVNMTNQDTLARYCDLGYDLLDVCSIDDKYPLNRDKFTKFCCDGDSKEMCGIAAENCVNQKATFHSMSYDLQNVDTGYGIADASKIALKSYCDLGNLINSSNCKLDQYHPKNDSVFKRLCCNDSNDTSLCNDQAQQCIIDKSNIKELSVQPLTTEGTKQYCTTGRNVLENCSIIQNYPINDATFRSRCCNNSTDVNDCTVGAVDCPINKANFVKQANTVKNLNPNYYLSNQDTINSYCALGRQIIDARCVIDDQHPMNDETFKTMCCNASPDTNKCNSASLQCTYDKNSFSNLATTFSGMLDRQLLSTTQYEPTSQKPGQFCAIGTAIATTCATNSSTWPLNNREFNRFCCLGTNDISVCGSNALNSALIASDFAGKMNSFTERYYYSGMNSSLLAFCQLGDKVIAAKSTHMVDPMSNYVYANYCANRQR